MGQYEWEKKSNKNDLGFTFKAMATESVEGESFETALASRQFNIDGMAIADSQLHRCFITGDKPRSLNGWYVCYGDYGIFGSWKEDWVDKWSNYAYSQLSESDKLENKRRMQEAIELRNQQSEIRHSEAAVKAKQIFMDSSVVDSDAYLNRKGVHNYGLRQNERGLIVPLRNSNDEILSLQFIKEDGSKRFLTGGRKKGLYHKIEGSGDVFLVEGYATGASVHEATEATVIVCFDAGNIKEVAKEFPTAVIAADNDDVGLEKARATGLRVIYPEFMDTAGDPTDFNDLHQKEGIDSVREQFGVRVIDHYEDSNNEGKSDTCAIPFGAAKDIVDYYNATASRKQPLFAVQTSLAILSTILGRRFRTDDNNFTALYFLNVGLSCTGKEHAKTVIEDVLHECDYSKLVGGDGFTSDSAVFGAVYHAPSNITVIDEFGFYLKSSNSSNSHVSTAINALMQTIGRCHSVLRPKTYSVHGKNKAETADLLNQKVHNPSLTMLAATTPTTLFGNMDSTQIKDGFFGRFITVISNVKRQPRQSTSSGEKSMDMLRGWCEQIEERYKSAAGELGYTQMPEVKPTVVTVPFSQAARKSCLDFEQECIDKMDELDKDDLAEMAGRTAEFAMRMSLILALAENPWATEISDTHVQWSVEYLRECLKGTISAVKTNMHGSSFEEDKMLVLKAIRKLGKQGLTNSEWQRKKPFSKYDDREQNSIITALVAAGNISEPVNVREGLKGGARVAWVAINRTKE